LLGEEIMIITKKSIFTATLLKNDERTGFKKGKIFYPKGVYWNRGDVILVGQHTVGEHHGHSVRLAFPADSVDVEVS
jgi:hypothetical protein